MKLVIEQRNEQVIGSITDISFSDAELLMSLIHDWVEVAKRIYEDADKNKSNWPDFAWYKYALVSDVETSERYFDAFEIMHRALETQIIEGGKQTITINDNEQK
jgi:hypothetical protein